MTVHANILYLPGTNCHRETAEAFRRVGAASQLVFLSDMLRGRVRLEDADLICLPGGFSFGDHTGAGNVAGWHLRTRLAEQLDACRQKPMMCICNGFQIAARAGIFGAVSLQPNQSGTFYDEPGQRHVVVQSNSSFWLDGLRGATLTFPCAHGEGRFISRDHSGWERALLYPADANPDGSADDIAGITTSDGLVLGVMDHPERAIDEPYVLDLFANAVRQVQG